MATSLSPKTATLPPTQPIMVPARNTVENVLGIPDFQTRGRSLHRRGGSSSYASSDKRPASLMAANMDHYEMDPDLLFGQPEGAYIQHIEDREQAREEIAMLERQGDKAKEARDVRDARAKRKRSDGQGARSADAGSGEGWIRRISDGVSHFGATVRRRVGSLGDVWRKDSAMPAQVKPSDDQACESATDPLLQRAESVFGESSSRVSRQPDGGIEASRTSSGIPPELTNTLPPYRQSDAEQYQAQLAAGERDRLNEIVENLSNAVKSHVQKGSFKDKNRDKGFMNSYGQDPDPQRQWQASSLLKQEVLEKRQRRDEAFRRRMTSSSTETQRLRDTAMPFASLFRSRTTGQESASTEPRLGGERKLSRPSGTVNDQYGDVRSSSESMAAIEAAAQGLMRLHSAW